MKLKEMINTMESGNRVIIRDESGTELYRGFGACFKYSGLNGEQEVRSHRICTEARKRNTNRFIPEPYPEPVALEHIGQFAFKDIEIVVYTEMVISA